MNEQYTLVWFGDSKINYEAFKTLSDKKETGWKLYFAENESSLKAKLTQTRLIIIHSDGRPNFVSFIKELKELGATQDYSIFLVVDENEIELVDEINQIFAVPFTIKKCASPSLLLIKIKLMLLSNQRVNDNKKQLQSILKEKNEFEQFKTHLENQLIDRTTELKDTYEALLKEMSKRKSLSDELSESTKELDIFIYKASHELKGPISSLIGLVNLAKIEVMDATSKNYFDMIDSSAKKLNKTLASLLEVTNIKYVDVKMKSADLQALVDELEHRLLKDLLRENVELQKHIKISGDIHSDNHLLSTLLYQILINSIQYANKESKNSWVRLDISTHNNLLIILIEDNGQGIEDHAIGKVFDLFYKYNEYSKGAGVGLYIAKQCIEKLDGKIELSSELNKGTTVKVTLPLSNN